MWENSKKYAGNIVFIFSQPSSQDGAKIRQSGSLPNPKTKYKKTSQTNWVTSMEEGNFWLEYLWTLCVFYYHQNISKKLNV
jgi:hypothetical protein